MSMYVKVQFRSTICATLITQFSALCSRLRCRRAPTDRKKRIGLEAPELSQDLFGEVAGIEEL